MDAEEFWKRVSVRSGVHGRDHVISATGAVFKALRARFLQVTVRADRAAWLAWRDAQRGQFLSGERTLYPTFVRDKRFIDYLLFWIPLTFEAPGVPVGTPGSGPRRTYQGSEVPPDTFRVPERATPDAPPRESGGG